MGHIFLFCHLKSLLFCECGTWISSPSSRSSANSSALPQTFWKHGTNKHHFSYIDILDRKEGGKTVTRWRTWRRRRRKGRWCRASPSKSSLILVTPHQSGENMILFRNMGGRSQLRWWQRTCVIQDVQVPSWMARVLFSQSRNTWEFFTIDIGFLNEYTGFIKMPKKTTTGAYLERW